MEITLIKNSLDKVRLRRHAPKDIIEIEEQVTTMIENDIIESSISQFSSNCHLVPKKNGQRRLEINFIPLNRIAIKDHYPITQVSDLFNSLRGKRYYATLDCTEGFLQIHVAKENRHKLAFITPFGSYQYKRVPFGFTNSPAKFQRIMNNIFGHGLYKRCIVYIDDILVFGETQEELLVNLEWVFTKCREFNVKLKKSKCKFLETTVEFLGFSISFNSISPIPHKLDPISDKLPVNKTDVLSILGTLNYYSRFIPAY